MSAKHPPKPPFTFVSDKVADKGAEKGKGEIGGRSDSKGKDSKAKDDSKGKDDSEGKDDEGDSEGGKTQAQVEEGDRDATASH